MAQKYGINHLHHIRESLMTDLGPTYNEIAFEPNDATDDSAVIDSSVQPPAGSTPVATESPSNPVAEVPVARETSVVKKAPVPKPKQAATKKTTAKKAAPRKAKPAKPVATKSSTKKATSGKKAAVVKKAAVAKKVASTKAGVRDATPKKVTSAKNASVKKTTAKKSGTRKANAVKAVVASSPVTRPTTPRKVLATAVQAASPEPVRDAAKTKAKLVRDSFTMPQQDFGLIAVLKDRALGFKRPTKKSELLRAGLHALQQLTATQLRGVLDSLAPLKAGRPKKKAN